MKQYDPCLERWDREKSHGLQGQVSWDCVGEQLTFAIERTSAGQGQLKASCRSLGQKAGL